VAEVEAGARLDAADHRGLRAAVGWETPALDDGALQAALERTRNVVAREDGEIVGMVAR
jgi:hypothetical protein